VREVLQNGIKINAVLLEWLDAKPVRVKNTTACLFFKILRFNSRACMLLARFLELNFEIKEVNIPNDEQFNEDFAKLNPAKKIPVLVDGDFVLSESRAILAYLVNSRKPGSSLYPSDPKERGIVDQRLYYDATVFLPNMLAVIVS
jgi:glutathione S-transferase